LDITVAFNIVIAENAMNLWKDPHSDTDFLLSYTSLGGGEENQPYSNWSRMRRIEFQHDVCCSLLGSAYGLVFSKADSNGKREVLRSRYFAWIKHHTGPGYDRIIDDDFRMGFIMLEQLLLSPSAEATTDISGALDWWERSKGSSHLVLETQKSTQVGQILYDAGVVYNGMFLRKQTVAERQDRTVNLCACFQLKPQVHWIVVLSRPSMST